MNATGFLTLLALALSGASLAGAQDKVTQSQDPDLTALQHQNSILEEKIKLATQQREWDRLHDVDPLTKQSEVLEQRMKLISQQQSLLRLPATHITGRGLDGPLEIKEDTSIESARLAYTALSGIAADVAKDLNCAGKNIVLFGPAQSEALLSLRTFNDQVDLLRARLKMVMDIQAPSAPDKAVAANANVPAAASSVFGAAALAGPVLQSVLDLISLFHGYSAATSADLPVDESGLIAVIANAATVQGCFVYWPDQYAPNPFNPASQVMAVLQSAADLNDSNDAAGKTAGLQQRIRALKPELKRADAMSQNLSEKIELEQNKLAEASKRVDTLKARIDWMSTHVKDDKDAVLQAKLNKTFERSWDELEAAVKRQLGSSLPATMEEQSKLGEFSKRVDLLKTQTDLLSRYIKDDKDLAFQDKVKRALITSWDELEAAVKNHQTLVSSVPRNIESDMNERKRWDSYSSELKELITATTAASEAYTTFRGALLDGSAGTSPLSRLLRAEALRDLTFDEKSQERAGSSVVRLKLEKLAGTSHTKVRADAKEGFSGGVVLSFVQYEPNGKLKNSGVRTAYSGFQSQP